MYQSDVLEVRKRLVKASISGFYRTISVNAGICRHQLVKVQNERWVCPILYSAGPYTLMTPICARTYTPSCSLTSREYRGVWAATI